MILTKHENIQKSTLVVGSEIITYLKKNGSENIEKLFQLFRDNVGMSLNQYHNILTILWLGKIINVKNHRVHLN